MPLTEWYLKIATFMLHEFHLSLKKFKKRTLLKIILQIGQDICSSQVNPYVFVSVILSDSELAPCPLGEMCFPFRDYLHSRMWPSNFLRRSGNAWPLLRGPSTGTWCWRPTETCCLWVRMTSFQSCPWVSSFSLCAPWEALMSFIWEFWLLGHDTASEG